MASNDHVESPVREQRHIERGALVRPDQFDTRRSTHHEGSIPNPDLMNQITALIQKESNRTNRSLTVVLVVAVLAVIAIFVLALTGVSTPNSTSLDAIRESQRQTQTSLIALSEDMNALGEDMSEDMIAHIDPIKKELKAMNVNLTTMNINLTMLSTQFVDLEAAQGSVEAKYKKTNDKAFDLYNKLFSDCVDDCKEQAQKEFKRQMASAIDKPDSGEDDNADYPF